MLHMAQEVTLACVLWSGGLQPAEFILRNLWSGGRFGRRAVDAQPP
jgi:hypothetical protein